MADANYLLDTHCLIWFQLNNGQIPETVLNIIQNPDNVILFSQVSLFEITIKQKVGKLNAFYATVEEVYQQGIKDGFTFVSIQNQHLYNYNNIPLVQDHRDPFDRLLISTAIVENAIILSADEKFKQYSEYINILWK
jgi:PIN domain nuclease of toxin-antitoxin system